MPALTFLPNGIVRSALLWTGRLALVLYFAAATLILVGRHWVMPEIGLWRGTIEQKLSEAIGLRVEIGGLTANWPGLHPHLVIDKLQLHDPQGNPALALERVEAEIGWTSLLFMELRLHRLEIAAPSLEIRRDASGVFHVAGLPLSGEGDSGFADWLLEQYRIVVRNARITWRDELRGAPPLELDKLNLVLRNLGRHHSVGLTAEPSGGIAASIDLRANLTGRSLNDLADWEGATYADLAQLDLAALAPWIELPLEMTRGKGDMKLWLDFAKLMPTGFTADLQLSDLNLRLQPELSPLALSRIEGRVTGRKKGDDYSGEVKRFSLATDSGIEVPPTQASLKLDMTGRGQGGELQSSQIDLAALGALAEHFPLPQNVRERLQTFAPQGQLEGFSLAWQGPVEAPEHWRIKGGFAALALAAHKELPGFSGISGRLEGDERSGQVYLDSQGATIVLPAVFPEPTLALAKLEAEIGWRGKPGVTEILFQRVNFRNEDARGEASGTYRHTGQGPGDIDLSAKLTDAAGDAVWRYMPLVVNKDARDWLRASILGGRADSTTLRLKGPLEQFPFRGGKGGIFQVKGTFQGAKLDYATGWPGITDIDGELLFESERMLIRGQRAKIMGVALSEVRAEIADLAAHEELLTVTGRAKGETQRFLDFIEASPVGERIDHFTETMVANGNGELDLKLVLPLRQIDTSQVQGRYRFADNQLEVLRELPPFTSVQGELSFTHDKLQAKNLRARFLDQPMTVEVGSQSGGTVRIGATGSLETNALRRFYGLRALEHLSGETPWRGTLNVKKPAAELRIESDLRGLASSLPEPFNKSALTALPLSVTGRIEPQRDEWTVTLGTAAGLRLQQAGQANDGWRGRLAIGEAALKATAALPAQGIALAINVPTMDVEAWQTLLQNGNGNNGTDKENGLPPLSVIDVRSADLRVAHRRFHDVQLQATRSDSRWQATVSSREAQGQLNWDSAGAGRIAGRLARLYLPSGEAAGADEPTPEQAREMPAVDLVIDSLKIGELQLGEAKVKAENREGVWQAKLDVKNEAAKFSGEGRWRPARVTPETALKFKLDVNNAEKLLERMGMPDAVRRGDGEIEGDVRWAGSPFAFDLPSLSGSIKADIGKGQFKKLEPGVGRLLGVLSLQSLPRRITLDFRDIFSEGFAFDSITGAATIAKGVMTTDELSIRGPSAKVLLSGQADLVAETQNLKVRVQPAIGETLAVGAMIANPAAGAVAWAAQKILKDPLDQIFAFEYAVTGGWSDPQVAKISRKLPEQNPNVP